MSSIVFQKLFVVTMRSKIEGGAKIGTAHSQN